MAFRSARRLKADAFSVFRKWVHLPSHRRRFPPYESGELVPCNDTWDKYRRQHSWLSREYRKGVSHWTQGQRVIQGKPRFSTPKRSSVKVPAAAASRLTSSTTGVPGVSRAGSLTGWEGEPPALPLAVDCDGTKHADEEEDWDSTLNGDVSVGRNHLLALSCIGRWTEKRALRRCAIFGKRERNEIHTHRLQNHQSFRPPRCRGLLRLRKHRGAKSRAPKKRVRRGIAITSITPRRNGARTFKILSHLSA
jgi:hypothetical protein